MLCVWRCKTRLYNSEEFDECDNNVSKANTANQTRKIYGVFSQNLSSSYHRDRRPVVSAV